MRRRTFILASPLVPALTACGGGSAPPNAAPGTTPGAAPVSTARPGTPAPSAGATVAVTKRIATIELEKGASFTMDLFGAETPKWIENFVQKANAGFYNGLTFHRVEDWVVQGGDPTGNGTGGGNTIPTETSRRPFVAGSAGVARRQDPRVSNDAQFFVVKTPGPANLGGKWTQLDEQYTNFGQVTEGMDHVRAIAIGDKIKRILIK